MACRILVADDSTPIQKVIRIAFSKYQVEIVTAGSLTEAIKECERLKPELIVADASLPGVSMASDFSRLLGKAPNAAVIVLMGTYDAVRESDIRETGLSTILKKPFDAIELLEASEKLLPGQLLPVGTKEKTNSSTAMPPPPPAQTAPLPRPPVASIPVPPAPAPDHAYAHSSTQVPPAPPAVMQGIPSFALDDEPAIEAHQVPAAPPKLDLAKKGLPAFDMPISQAPSTTQTIPATSATSVAGISAAVEDFVRKELPALVDRAVERYCAEHFKGLAREVLTTELRRLAEEKARYLVDQ